MDQCSFTGCDLPVTVRGLCHPHYQQAKRGGTLKPLREGSTKKDRICHFPDCGRPWRSRGLCEGHLWQERQGKALKPIKTQRKPGEGSIHVSGYLTVHRNGKRLTKHRAVMEDHLERPLTSDESVHHKNGDKLDNRLENLELRVRYHGKGQNVTDQIEWAKDFLVRYAGFVWEDVDAMPWKAVHRLVGPAEPDLETRQRYG